MSGKKYKAVRDKIKSEGVYPLDKALQMVIENPVARFDESVDAALVLGVDTRKNDQQVRGSVALPHGLGRKVRILVFAKGALEEDAKKAGADFVGGEDMVEKIKQGWLDFDCAISTPDMMPVVSKVAKTLGPKGLMPNPKLGTVTIKVAQAVEREKKGTASFRADKNGIIHSSVGRRSMGLD
ncbi:MAG: 50S ribosomal protein L1, partial [Oligoflexia bacterium]|nr:50S ribosomal protein L1 [Oligoflexia bacterium]